MASYWRLLPTFRLARQVCWDNHRALAAHRFFRDRYFDTMFRAMPWATHSELNKMLDRNSDTYRKHWEDFARDMKESFGGMFPWEQDAKDKSIKDKRSCHDDQTVARSTGAREDQPSPSFNDSLSPNKPARDFEMTVDLRGFTPEEISVRIVGNVLRVQARHQSEGSQGDQVLRSYTREIILPEGVDLDALKTSLNHQGMLNLSAPGREVFERQIPIGVAEQASEKVGEAIKNEAELQTDEAEEIKADKTTDNK